MIRIYGVYFRIPPLNAERKRRNWRLTRPGDTSSYEEIQTNEWDNLYQQFEAFEAAEALQRLDYWLRKYHPECRQNGNCYLDYEVTDIVPISEREVR